MRKHLTAKAIEALKPAPSGKRYDVADAIVPGFGVRVNDKGRKSFTLRSTTDGFPRRHAVGKNLAARIDIALTTAIIVAICAEMHRLALESASVLVVFAPTLRTW